MKKIVDNFYLFAKKLFETPLEEDEFYFIQILVRGKDGHKVNGNNKTRMVKFYTVNSAEKLLKYKDEIIAISRINNARAYIHPVKRNMKEVAAIMVENTVHAFVTGNYKEMKSMFPIAAGQSFMTSDKKFLIDLDDIHEGDDILNQIRADIFSMRGHGGEESEKVFMSVPTKSGIHLITWPFDLGQFKVKYPNIDVHKNNPTLLYYEWEVENELKKNLDDAYTVSTDFGRSMEYNNNYK